MSLLLLQQVTEAAMNLTNKQVVFMYITNRVVCRSDNGGNLCYKCYMTLHIQRCNMIDLRLCSYSRKNLQLNQPLLVFQVLLLKLIYFLRVMHCLHKCPTTLAFFFHSFFKRHISFFTWQYLFLQMF